MATTQWVCDVCNVKNEDKNTACCCCETERPKSAALGPSSGAASDLKDGSHLTTSVTKHAKKENFKRVRMSYNAHKLPVTCAFICGSAEIDQIPAVCCDVRANDNGDGKKAESLYECKYPTPMVRLTATSPQKVACGALHTAFVSSTGQVYTFGCNDMGALGRSPKDTEKYKLADSMPFKVRLSYCIVKVTCGDNHTLFLGKNGRVFFCGGFKDSSGDIGVANYSNFESLEKLKFIPTPVLVPCIEQQFTNIVDICSGENHCVLLPLGGAALYTFGSNEFGQMMIPEDGIKIYVEDDVDLSQPDLKKLALTWPQFNTLDELGLSVSPSGKRKRTPELVQKIFTGYCTTFVCLGTNQVLGAGRNGQGEVGCGDAKSLSILPPREITALHGMVIQKMGGGQFFSWALDSNGNMYTWGKRDYTGHGHSNGKEYQPLTAPKLLRSLGLQSGERVRFSFNGADTCFSVTNEDRVLAWGSSQNYILGNGKDEDVAWVPQKIAKSRFCHYKIIDGMGGSQHTVFLGTKY